MTAPTGPQVSETVRRVLARNDLLDLAAAADLAVGIVRQREALPRRSEDEPGFFALALSRQLAKARDSGAWAVRAQAWDYAGVIVRFCAMIGIDMRDVREGHTAEDLHAAAMRELEEQLPSDGSEPLDKDLTLGVFHKYHAARDLRLGGDVAGALRLSTMMPVRKLYASGAEAHAAHFNYEVGAGLITAGRAADVEAALRGSSGYWTTNERAVGFSTRYRYDFIRGLAAWADDDSPAQYTRDLLDSALRQATATAAAGDGGDRSGVQELSAALALAEFLAAGPLTGADVAAAVRLGRRALDITEGIRGRWRVIARSRAPLAVAFRRVYGDIALLAARLSSAGSGDGADLGFRVALSAKQTGFASRIRAGRLLTSPLVGGLIEDIVELEDQADRNLADTPAARARDLHRLHFDLAEAVSPMLADTVLPQAADVDQVLDRIGGRHALDFVQLPETLYGQNTWFRTYVRPDRSMRFEQFTAGPGLAGFALGVAADARDDEQHDRGARELRPQGQARADGSGQNVAEEVLPAELLRELRACGVDGRADDRADPLPLLISAHSTLSLLPWAALRIDAAGTRLVQRALAVQCPVFTCLQHDRTPPVEGAALIRLVAKTDLGSDRHAGVDVECERAAWGLDDDADRVPLSRCEVGRGATPVAQGGTLVEALTGRTDWQFLHIASHGGGDGLAQHLRLSPPDRSLTAGKALSLRWPASVLMASCHVGRLINPEDAEPLNFVMALLTGGARCIVAGIDRIHDELTGKAASRMVCDIRENGVPLDVALRNAQLAALREEADESGWALLSAYTC